MTGTESDAGTTVRPTLRVVSGSPTPEELAALAAIVTAAGAAPGAGAATVPRRRGGWSDPSAMHRRTYRPGPNAWRASAR